MHTHRSKRGAHVSHDDGIIVCGLCVGRPPPRLRLIDRSTKLLPIKQTIQPQTPDHCRACWSPIKARSNEGPRICIPSKGQKDLARGSHRRVHVHSTF